MVILVSVLNFIQWNVSNLGKTHSQVFYPWAFLAIGDLEREKLLLDF